MYPKVILSYASSSVQSAVPITDNQFIVCLDNGDVYADYNGKRFELSKIIILETDMDRVSMSSPTNKKFYYSKDTGILWYYENGWSQVGSKAKRSVKEFTETDWTGNTAPYTFQISKTEHNLTGILDVNIYQLTENGYLMTHGLYDNLDYSVLINSDNDITISTNNKFSGRIIINS